MVIDVSGASGEGERCRLLREDLAPELSAIVLAFGIRQVSVKRGFAERCRVLAALEHRRRMCREMGR